MPEKLTNEQFINRANLIHNNKYDYSLVEYENAKIKVKIICPEHGEFLQISHNHLMGQSCPKCGREKVGRDNKLSNEEFIQKAKLKHGSKYDYSLVDYKNCHEEIKIICKTHNETFLKTPHNHLRGYGCRKCGLNNFIALKRLTNEEFIQKAKIKHRNKYDYSLVDYQGNHKKIKIICPKHGVFEQTPSNHLNYDCEKCGTEKITLQNSFTQDEYINKVKLIHGNKYDYSKVKYYTVEYKITIICPEHGEFDQLASNHLTGHGCKKCYTKLQKLKTEDFIKRAITVHGNKYDYKEVNCETAINKKVKIFCNIHKTFFFQNFSQHLIGQNCPECGLDNVRLSTEEFINKSKIIHNNKYDYSLVDYKGSFEKVIIICPNHGKFEQSSASHLRGNGCHKCSSSKGEIKIRSFLEKFNLSYIPQYKFENCKHILKLYFDFYLPDYNLCIEFNGRQHYQEIDYFTEKLKKRQLRDNIKYNYCKNNNISLLIIKYDENIEEKLKEYFNL